MSEIQSGMAPVRTLLLVSYHFPPSAASGSYRLLGFARHLPRFGWRTVVVAPRTTPFEPVDEELGRRVPAGTGRIELPFRWSTRMRPHLWLFPTTFFRLELMRWASRAARAAAGSSFDAVLTSGPPHEVHLAGLRLKRQHGVPWVADFRDPWVANTWMTLNADGLPRGWTVRMERAVVREADLIITNAPAARAALVAAFPEHAEKIVSLTNGYDPEVFEGLQRRSDPEGEGRWMLLHPGEMYAGRDPRHLLEALAGLLRTWPSDRPQPRLQLLGGRHMAESVRGELDRLGLTGVVTQRGHVPHREALQAMVDADVLVLLDTAGRKTGVPAKLYEFLGAGRPILALAEPDSDTASVLQSSGVEHRIARPNDAPAIEQALRELAAAPGGEDLAPGRLQFTRECLTGQLAKWLDRLIDRARQPVASPGDHLPV